MGIGPLLLRVILVFRISGRSKASPTLLVAITGLRRSSGAHSFARDWSPEDGVGVYNYGLRFRV